MDSPTASAIIRSPQSLSQFIPQQTHQIPMIRKHVCFRPRVRCRLQTRRSCVPGRARRTQSRGSASHIARTRSPRNPRYISSRRLPRRRRHHFRRLNLNSMNRPARINVRFTTTVTILLVLIVRPTRPAQPILRRPSPLDRFPRQRIHVVTPANKRRRPILYIPLISIHLRRCRRVLVHPPPYLQRNQKRPLPSPSSVVRQFRENPENMVPHPAQCAASPPALHSHHRIPRIRPDPHRSPRAQSRSPALPAHPSRFASVCAVPPCSSHHPKLTTTAHRKREQDTPSIRPVRAARASFFFATISSLSCAGGTSATSAALTSATRRLKTKKGPASSGRPHPDASRRKSLRATLASHKPSIPSASGSPAPAPHVALCSHAQKFPLSPYVRTHIRTPSLQEKFRFQEFVSRKNSTEENCSLA